MPQQLHMIWPGHPTRVPEQAVPRGYSVRPLRDGDESGHVRVMHEAGFVNWTEAQLATWRQKIALPDGIFVAVHESRGEIVATALASHRPTDLHPSGGELGWVAGDPVHAGKGLGMAVCIAALRRLLNAGYHRIYLLTDDHRSPAIKTYLKMGFVPFLCGIDMEGRWRSVAERLGWRIEPDTWARAPEDPGVREQTEEPPDRDSVERYALRHKWLPNRKHRGFSCNGDMDAFGDESLYNMKEHTTKPNIVYFLVDDMGYGDASCLNPEGKIKTPNIDRLAGGGMKFADAHSSSAVCSPSRYSVLTGRYNWRSTLQRGIVGVYGNPLIAEERLTAAAFLRQHGYHSACIGKWHLGMGWDFEADEDFKPKHAYDSAPDRDLDATEQQRRRWREAFSKPTTGGPTTRGFDYYFGVDVPNWPPYAFIENDHTVGIPCEFLPSRLLGDNQASIAGPAMPYWHFEQLLPTWARKADAYIRGRAKAGEPFFLYLAMTSPHTPLSVNKRFIGKSGLDNLYADLVIETDHVFGRVLDSLAEHGVADNTLVVFASDNGCAHYVGAREDGRGRFESAMEPRGHFPSGTYRGYKSDAWDGGHRIPCIARWPGVIAPGSTCDQLVCLSDLMATCAEIVGDTLPDSAGEDSVSMLPLFANPRVPIRDHVIHHSIDGKFAIRHGRWKLVLCPGSGGWTHNDADAAEAGSPLVQLYDMRTDPGETRNLHAGNPGKVKELIALLKKYVADGRSTPGARQENDVVVDIWKLDTMPGVDPARRDDY